MLGRWQNIPTAKAPYSGISVHSMERNFIFFYRGDVYRTAHMICFVQSDVDHEKYPTG